MNSIISIYIFIFGLCIGSFLNVFILRGLKNENFVFARSKCPKCNNQLKWYMNIPLVSYIFLLGRCAYCKEKISIQYPIVELTTGCFFLLSYLNFGLSVKTFFVCIFLSLFISIALTDILETVVIDYHTYILLAAALLYAFLNIGQVNIWQALIGAIGSFVILECIARVGYLIANFRIFGEGDSLIALGLGAMFGIRDFIIILCLSILIQSIGAIPMLFVNALKQQNKRLASSYVIVLISIILVFYINYINTPNSAITYTGFLILILTGLIWSLKNILASVKNKKELEFDEAKERFLLLPFGPAMIIAGIIGIFYMEQVKIAIKLLLY